MHSRGAYQFLNMGVSNLVTVALNIKNHWVSSMLIFKTQQTNMFKVNNRNTKKSFEYVQS